MQKPIRVSSSSEVRRIFSLIIIFMFAFCNGLNFNVLSGAVYCIDQLANRSTNNFTAAADLPSYLVDTAAVRSSLFAAYNWLAVFLIIPTLLACEYGGTEWAFLAARTVQGGLEFLMPYCKFAQHTKINFLIYLHCNFCNFILSDNEEEKCLKKFIVH